MAITSVTHPQKQPRQSPAVQPEAGRSRHRAGPGTGRAGRSQAAGREVRLTFICIFRATRVTTQTRSRSFPAGLLRAPSAPEPERAGRGPR